jgi:transposase
MEMFYTHLVRMLDDKNKYWRRNTIILCDGASYHTSEAMRLLYSRHQIPIMFTGPHSYAASPIELFFAAFKKNDINPSKVKTGKE